MKNGMKKILSFWWVLLILISLLACYSTHWVLDTYDNPSFEQILFHLTEPVPGVERTLLYSFLKHCLLAAFVVTIVFSLGITMLMAFFHSLKFNKIMKIGMSVVTVFITIFCLHSLGFFRYLIDGNQESTFIEENFVDPRNVKIEFPEKKRNLIYIYAESLESSYLSISEGGLQDVNLMPELTTLAKENISFSDTDKIGGAYQLNGMTWTTAAIISHTAGIPLKMGISLINFQQIPNFLEGVYTMGEILDKEGYNQVMMFGSDGNFGNRKSFFTTHGGYNVYDYYDAIGKGRIDDDYLVFWGYEDSKLFEYAKEEVLKLSQDDEPFNFSLLTVNTHNPEGYLEESCPKKYDNQYKNVIACSSYQINEFIEWCKKQDFYENTTIVITGDHLSMADNFFKNSDSEHRRVFNTFINSSVEPVNKNNRLFSTLDMFPTTLASIGATIDGNKLGLGTNLFSNEKTLVEMYGFDKVDKEFTYKSDFYNKEILLMK